MKIIKLALLATTAIALFTPKASAIPFGTNAVYKFGNSIFFSGPAEATSTLNFPGGKTNVKSGVPNACGVVKISLGSSFATATQVKINGAAAVAYSSLPAIPGTSTCNSATGVGNITTNSKDSANNLYIYTASTTTIGTAEYVTPVSKNIKYNGCGFYELKSSTSLPFTANTTFTFENSSYNYATLPTATTAGPYCRTVNSASVGYKPASW